MSINIKSPHEYLNATVVGTPTINEGVVSGFSTSNYLFLPPALDVSGGKTWEAVVKLHTGTFTTNEYQVILRGSVEYTGFVLQTNGNVFSIFASSNGTSMDIASNVRSTLTLDNDTTYWVKASFNGSQYLVDVSTDNQNWINYVTIASTLSVYTGDYVIGCNIPAFSTRAPFQGSIDLNESYIKINGEYWWRGVEVDQYREIKRLYKYDKPRYFKNVTEITYVDWTQPTLSTDGTVGGDSYACRADSEYRTDAATYQAYKAFDKNTGTFWSSSSKTSAWLEFYSPVTIRPTKVTLTNRSSATNPFKNVTVTGSLDGSEYFTLATYTNANSSNSAAWDIVIDNPQTVKYVRVAGDGLVTSNTLSQAEMLVTATQEIVATSTIEVNLGGEDVYGEWVQPVLTDNGTMGGDSFAVTCDVAESSYPAYKAFNGSTSDFCSLALGNIDIYNPTKLNVTQIAITNRSDGDNSITGYTIYGSNDYSSWTSILTGTNDVISSGSNWNIDLSSNSNSYKFYRLAVTSANLSSNHLQVAEIVLKAQELKAVGGNDYDYSEQNPMLIKQVYKTDKTKYYKYIWEDYALPVMTSNTSPSGVVETDVVMSGLSTNPYSLFFGNTVTVNANANRSLKYIKYTFENLLYSGDYVFGYTFSRQSNVSVKEHRWELIYSDDTTEEILNDTNIAVDSPKEFVVPFTAKKFIKAIKINIYVDASSNKYCYANLSALSLTSQGKDKNVVKKLLNTYEVNLGGEDVYGDWEQPILTANGTMGGDSFAVTASSTHSSAQPYYAFNGLTGVWENGWIANIVAYLQFYNPKPLVISNIRIQNVSASEQGDQVGYVKGYVIQASNTPYDEGFVDIVSGINEVGYDAFWDISIDNKNAYKYWRFKVLSWSSTTWHAVSEITITAQELKAIGGDEYDYSVVIPQLVYEHNPTVFEQSTAGTYTFNVTEEAPYEITLVGGGGGGAFNSSGNAGSAAAGNSGSGLVVNAILKAGTYVLNVGAGGAWSGWLDANTWGGNGSQSSISKDGVVIATAGGGTGNHAWWRSGSAHNSTVGAAPTYTDELGVRDVILNRQGNWGGLAATSSGGASVISGTTWGKGGDTRNRNAADNGNAGCIRIVRLEK